MSYKDDEGLSPEVDINEDELDDIISEDDIDDSLLDDDLLVDDDLLAEEDEDMDDFAGLDGSEY